MTIAAPVWRSGALAGAALALAACAGPPNPGLPGVVVTTVPEAATPALAPAPESPELLMNEAVADLDAGRVDDARAKLQLILSQAADDHAAAELLASLDEDPIHALGREHVAYRAKAGDTMESLATRFLHDRAKFYLLARYNDLPAGGVLTPGQRLKIPVPARRATSRAAYVKQAPRAPEPVAAPPPQVAAAVPPADPARARRLRASALEALDRGQAPRAVALLEAAAAADPTDATVQHDLARARRIEAVVATR
jgi:hypothetical protein